MSDLEEGASDEVDKIDDPRDGRYQDQDTRLRAQSCVRLHTCVIENILDVAVVFANFIFVHQIILFNLLCGIVRSQEQEAVARPTST